MTNEIQTARVTFTMDDRFGHEWSVLLREWKDGVTTVCVETDAGSPYMKVTDYYELEFASAPSVGDILIELEEKIEEIADLQLN